MKRTNFFCALAGILGATGLVMVGCSDDPAAPNNPPVNTGDAAPDTNAPNQCADAGAPTGDCTNAKCTETNGEPSICRNNTCVKLKSADCPIVVGDISDDRTIIIGSIAPITGDSEDEGPPIRNSIELAMSEINAHGIRFKDVCEKPRTLAFVGCNEDSDANIENSAKHLVNDLGVPVIIGANFSGDTILAASVALPAKTLMISPSATAARITNLENATQDGTRIFWRTSPSDVIQSEAMKDVYTELEAIVKAGAGFAGDVKVAVLSKSDAYGLGVEAALKDSLVVNGKPHGENADGVVDFRCYNPGSEEAPTTQNGCPIENTQTAAKDALIAQKPHVIIITGTAEAATNIIIPYEATNPDPKPLYLLPDGMRTSPLTNYAKGKDEFIARIRGTVPGVVTPLAQDFFNFRYKQKFPENPTLIFGMAGAYDATYMLAYAIAANGSQPITGVNIAKGLAKLVGGTEKVDVGPSKLGGAFTTLINGGAIDINGSSGPLDFDPTTGEARSDIAVWCLRTDPNTGNIVYNDATGQSYDATQNKLVGTFACGQ